MPKKKPVGEPLPLDPKSVVERFNEVQAQLKLLEKEEKALKSNLMTILGDEDDFDIEDSDMPYVIHRIRQDRSYTDLNELKEKAIVRGVDLMSLPPGCTEVAVSLTTLGANYLVDQQKGLNKADLAEAFKTKFVEYPTVKLKKED